MHISMHPRIEVIRQIIDTPARVLLAKITEQAEQDSAYAAMFAKWLDRHESTILLRSIASPFGDYWSSLAHANAVDDLDSASIK